ncbi:hypothetical protein LSUE1_G002078 [Lachnellula suecica]|uniref:Heterokaryon incompatibility domain-containing protein n=1 Tax=Lachnellula suecica TaxID=602035 RepID=A0A8T9CC30_9HELO|nr:hypothetical protein LSUE1_G002078 [Lachnellula suecica]
MAYFNWLKMAISFNPMKLFGFDINVLGDPLASLFSMRPLSKDSSTDGCFEVASKWLQVCLEKHDKCPKQISPLPSRVIDVGNDETNPFVYISKGESGSWLALSHCWGLKQTFTATLNTIDALSHQILLSDLPETFKDAIFICRRLGFQYIWIDSLCIIQDSPKDWEAESKKMSMIYQNATATISADAADGDHQGIFKGAENLRNKFTFLTLPCHSSERSLNGNVLISIRQGRHDIKIMPLQTRAWVLQEKALSVRSLHYQQTGIFWRCQTVMSTEIRPSLMEPHHNKELHSIPRKHLPSRIDYGPSGRPQGDSASIAWWYSQVSDYTTRKLTYRKDRFPAIAGLAREFASRTGYHYMAGIWAEDFQRGFCWKGSVSESYSDIAPSWSWVGAEYSAISGHLYNGDLIMAHGKTFDAELVGFSEPDATDDFLGGGAATILSLRGWCADIEDFLAGNEFYHPWIQPPSIVSGSSLLGLKPSSLPENTREEDPIILWLDQHHSVTTVSTVLVEQHAVVLRICEFDTWDAGNPRISNVWALLLQPTGRPDGSYKRLGLIKIPSGKPSAAIEIFSQKLIRIA